MYLSTSHAAITSFGLGSWFLLIMALSCPPDLLSSSTTRLEQNSPGMSLNSLPIMGFSGFFLLLVLRTIFAKGKPAVHTEGSRMRNKHTQVELSKQLLTP